MSAFLALTIPAHHDIAWPLWVAERVLGGAELYVDVVEVHPPLIVGFAALAVLAAAALPLDAVAAYHAITLLLVATSLFLASRLLARAMRGSERWALLLVLGFVLFPFVGYSFGQEEHLMLTLTLPYLLLLGFLSAGRLVPRPQRLLLGALGGIGVSMKPFFGPLWLALVLYLAYRRGARRLLAAETLAPAAVIIAYIAVTALLTPGYFDVARMAAAVYFDFFPTPLATILFSRGTAAAGAALLAHALLPGTSELRDPRRVLLIALAGFYVAVLVQQKGWSYHWYPVYAAALLLVSLSGIDALRASAAGSTLRRACSSTSLRAVAIVLLCAAAVWRFSWTRTFWGDLSGAPFHLPQLTRVVENFAGDGPIAALSVGMPVAFPLVNATDSRWALRFACLWMIPGIYADVEQYAVGAAFPYERTGDAAELDRYVLDAVTSDLLRERPTLLIIDSAPPMPRLRGFGFVAYFARDPRFIRLMSEYGLIGTVGRYEVYRRVDA